jgi:hypothetical protein
MTGQIKFDQTSSLITEALLKAIAEEDRLVLRKKSDQVIRLHSKEGIDPFFSAIERPDYFIDLTCFEKNNETILTYRIRANTTYFTFGLVICLFSMPFLLVGLSAVGDSHPRYDLLIIFVSYSLFLFFIMFFIRRRQKSLCERGKRVIQNVLTEVHQYIAVPHR